MSFDIDIVYLWVDGEDSVWMKKLLEAKKEELSEEAISECRFKNNDELKFSIRSAKKFAPWIRNIYIVTDSQIPAWLKEGVEGLKIIDHKEILPEDALPCFNSCAIETCLHKIPGLSEYFLYANDDMFFWNNVSPEDFFTPDGKPVYRFSKRIFNKKYKHMYGYTINRAYHLIKNRYGNFTGYFPHHGIDPYRKSYIEECIANYKDEFDRTLHNKFRSFDDIQRAIFSYYAVKLKGAKVILPKGLLSKFGYTKEIGFIECNKKNLLKISKFHTPLMCINSNRKTTDIDTKLMVEILENKFCEKTEFEK